MLAFGVVGLLMKRFGFEAAPLVLAFVLGRMAEESIRQSLLMSSGRFSILLTRPIATVFIVAALSVVALPVLLPPVRRMLRTVPPDDTA
jgi:putative tricarboxylic transport membrane protein